MSNYYRYLNTPFDFFDRDKLVEEYSKTLNDPTKNKQWRIEGTKLNIIYDKSHEWFKKFDCEIAVAELFYTAPQSKIRWHIDASGYSPVFDYVKFNFVWSSNNKHYMQWGVPKDVNDVKEIGYNSAGSPHIIFQPDEIIEKESITIDKPILVNVGVPHRAVNDGDSERWCLCLIPKRNNKRISFEEAVDLFGDCVL